MPQKLITRKVDLPIVNLPVKCWRPCGSIRDLRKSSLGEVIIVAGSVKIQFQSRKLQGYGHNHKLTENTLVQLYSTWRRHKREGLFALMLLLSFLKNECHYRRSLRCLHSNPLASDYIMLAARLKSKKKEKHWPKWWSGFGWRSKDIFSVTWHQ